MTTARAGRQKEVGTSAIPLSSGGRTIHPCPEIDYTPRSARVTPVLTVTRGNGKTNAEILTMQLEIYQTAVEEESLQLKSRVMSFSLLLCRKPGGGTRGHAYLMLFDQIRQEAKFRPKYAIDLGEFLEHSDRTSRLRSDQDPMIDLEMRNAFVLWSAVYNL